MADKIFAIICNQCRGELVDKNSVCLDCGTGPPHIFIDERFLPLPEVSDIDLIYKI